ncbi:MAG: hypothetical protein O2780_00755 [Proteobacteria bacterium]|jgi:chromosome segregation ATPase|nr:hypothetical protein [Pseudomonadota bacterium]MDA1300587.1 hypothetical protein [Pseudomonadota bacterium]
MNDKTDSIPAIKPALDQVAHYQRTGRTEAPRQSNFNGLLVFAIVLMAIMMGVGGYTIYEVQRKLDEANVLLEQGRENIDKLEQRLAATGTDVSKTLVDVRAQIDKNFEQIDLLWGHAYRKNKPAIEKNTADIVTLRKEMEAEVRPLAKSMTTMQAEVGTLAKAVKTATENIRADSEEITTQVSLIRGQVQDQAVIVEGNRRNVAALTKQLAQAQEAIDVIDRYRQQINQKIIELESRGRPVAPTGGL